MTTYRHNLFASDPVAVEGFTARECLVHTARGDLHVCNWGVGLGLETQGVPRVFTYQVGFKKDHESRSTSFLYQRARDLGEAVDAARETMRAMGHGSWVIVSSTDEY